MLNTSFVRRLGSCVAYIAIATLIAPGSTSAYEEQAHTLVNTRAAEQARIGALSLDEFLKTTLGFVAGLQTPIKDANGTTNSARKINSGADWIALGGVAEDTPFCRSTRHFHDPLELWENSGLNASDPLAAAVIVAACGHSS